MYVVSAIIKYRHVYSPSCRTGVIWQHNSYRLNELQALRMARTCYCVLRSAPSLLTSAQTRAGSRGMRLFCHEATLCNNFVPHGVIWKSRQLGQYDDHVTGWMTKESTFYSLQWWRLFFHQSVHNDSGVHPAYCTVRQVSSFHGRLKWRQCEINHTRPPTTEIKNAWRYTSILPLSLMVRCLIKLH